MMFRWSNVREIQTCWGRLGVDALESSSILSLTHSNTPSLLTERGMEDHLLNLYSQNLENPSHRNANVELDLTERFHYLY